jgi:MFS transporter, DHA1 family, multidrug resistance protein
MHNKMTPSVVVVFLALLLGIQPLATDLYLPALPALKDSLGASHAQAQLTFTAMLLAFGVSQLVWGPLSDRFGRKPILLTGTGLFVLACVGAALARNMEQLIVWRSLQGGAMGAAVMCARALIRDLYEPQAGARALSKGLTGLGVFAVSAGPLGAWLATSLGWQGAMWALAVFGVILWVLVLLCFHETVSTKNATALHPLPLLRNWLRIMRHPTFATHALLNVATYGALFTFLASSAFVYQRLHGMSLVEYGWVMVFSSAVFIAATFWCRRLLARWGLVHTVQVGGSLALCGGSLMGLLAWVGVDHWAALLLPHGLFMVSHGINQPCAQAGAVGPFPKMAGTAAALSGFWMMMAAFFMGGWLGAHMDGTSFALVTGMVFWTTMVALVAWSMVPRWGVPRS